MPRYLIGFYFPHETPLAMGPTRWQAGSHLYANPAKPANVVLEPVPAGTFFLFHFDMVHAGFPNRSDKTRYMVKFVFTRTRHPRAPSWDHENAEWQRPADCIPSGDLPEAWSAVWNWMRGAPGARTSGSAAADHLRNLGATDESARLRSVYALAAADTPVLVDHLLREAGKNKHQRALAKDDRGHPVPRDDVRGYPRRWNERAVVMEDAAYALAACGERAIPALAELLGHEDAWIRINAAFAIGEHGPAACGAVPALAKLLDSPESQVVRQALDALGAIGTGLAPALPRIEKLLTETNLEWLEPQVMRGWVQEDQVRMNAASVLLSAVHGDDDPSAIERIAAAALGDKNGYVSAIAAETLIRIGTPTANASALRFLSERRWDDTLMVGVKPF